MKDGIDFCKHFTTSYWKELNITPIHATMRMSSFFERCGLKYERWQHSAAGGTRIPCTAFSSHILQLYMSNKLHIPLSKTLRPFSPSSPSIPHYSRSASPRHDSVLPFSMESQKFRYPSSPLFFLDFSRKFLIICPSFGETVRMRFCPGDTETAVP